jgi:hypothetical protein
VEKQTQGKKFDSYSPACELLFLAQLWEVRTKIQKRRGKNWVEREKEASTEKIKARINTKSTRATGEC